MPSVFDRSVAMMNNAIDVAMGTDIVYRRPSMVGSSVSFKGPFKRKAAEPNVRASDVAVDCLEPRLDVTTGRLGSLGTPLPGDQFDADGGTWQVERVIYANASCLACMCTEVR